MKYILKLNNIFYKQCLILFCKYLETNYDSKEKNESNEIKPPSSSSSILTETCESFQDLYGYSIQARKCPSFAKFCCGRCMNRYCCDLNKERLNQKECKSMSVTSTIAHSSNS